MGTGASGTSRTAAYVACFRAIETRLAPSRRLFSDPFAEAFLDARLRALLAAASVPVTGRLVPAAIDRRTPGARVSVLVRTRYIDELLEAAASDGVRQLVILGAGFDARAFRLEVARRLSVYEVDEPAIQARKREVIARRLDGSPTHVSWVPVDFEHDDLAGSLRGAGLDPAAPAMFVWEGVTPYLTPRAVDATLRAVAGLGARGSRVVFTYLHRAALEGRQALAGIAELSRAVKRSDEPFHFGLEPSEVADYVSERGFGLSEQVSSVDLAVRYLHPRGRRPPASPLFRVAVAVRS